ncbi:MAG: MFS transporter [Chloroflexi bacterium]|nr:MFS transporter [Chloroflexota bacterium]
MSYLDTTSTSAKAVLVVVCIALFFQVLNASAVGVILPEIASGISASTVQVGWLMTGFLLVTGIAIPFYGRLADRYGARNLFIFGIALFSVGSLLAGIAANYQFLLVVRIVQAIGGAAIPGLGMTLVSRAYGPESRGMVLGIIAATIGVGSAAGPLLGGVLSELMGWRSVFIVTAFAALTIPSALKALPKSEQRLEGSLDLIGGIGLGLMVTGILLVPSEGSRAGWTSNWVIVGGTSAVIGLLTLAVRQAFAVSPFIHRELLRNAKYLALTGMSFTIMAANLAPLIGLPVLLAFSRGLSSLEIGLVMVPGAVLSAGGGLLSGRLTDRTGAKIPVRIGSLGMLLALFGLSAYSGSSPWAIAVFAGLMGAGFGLVNTPLAATISRLVSGEMLATALSMNSMMFFLGGSIGTALLFAFSTSSGLAGGSLNPLHSGLADGFSDGFLLLMIPVLIALGLSLALPAVSRPEISEEQAPLAEAQLIHRWTPDCSVPWHPECVETIPAVGD